MIGLIVQLFYRSANAGGNCGIDIFISIQHPGCSANCYARMLSHFTDAYLYATAFRHHLNSGVGTRPEAGASQCLHR